MSNLTTVKKNLHMGSRNMMPAITIGCLLCRLHSARAIFLCRWTIFSPSSPLHLCHHHLLHSPSAPTDEVMGWQTLLARVFTSGLSHCWQQTNHRFPLKLWEWEESVKMAVDVIKHNYSSFHLVFKTSALMAFKHVNMHTQDHSLRPTLFEGCEGEVRQVAAQLCIAGCLFELAVWFTGIKLEVKGQGNYMELSRWLQIFWNHFIYKGLRTKTR